MTPRLLHNFVAYQNMHHNHLTSKCHDKTTTHEIKKIQNIVGCMGGNEPMIGNRARLGISHKVVRQKSNT
jgi:hypothetical protein